MNKSVVLVCVIMLLIGFGIGYGYGFSKGTIKSLEWGLKISKHFVSIEFDEEEIAAMLWSYKNRVDRCYNGTN